MTEPVDFVREPLRGGGTRVNLMRLTDGRVGCCICFEFFTRDQLHHLPDGAVEDVCIGCAAAEERAKKRPSTP